MRWSLGLVGVATLAGGCKELLDDDGPPPPFTGTATLERAMVKLHLACPRLAEITIDGGKPETCFDMKLDTTIPAAAIGAGHHVFDVRAKRRNGQVLTTTIALDIPASATGPYFEVTGCEQDYQDRERVALELGGGTTPNALCETFHGARVKLAFSATPRAQLAIGGKTLAVPDAGTGTIVVELGDLLLARSLDDFVATSPGAAPPPMPVAWRLTAGPTALDGTLTIGERSYASGQLETMWMRALIAGKIDRPAFTPPKPGERKTVLLVGENGRDLYATDHRGTVRDLDLVAVERETGRREAGTCELEDHDKRKIVAKRLAVDLEVAVTSLADGKVVTTKAFPGPATGCPWFSMLDKAHPEVAVRVEKKQVEDWLETLATP